MDLDFYLPIKAKNVQKNQNAKLSIPADFLENIMTNRQRKRPNQNAKRENENSNKPKQSNTSETIINPKQKHSFSNLSFTHKRILSPKARIGDIEEILKENSQLRQENLRLKKMIENMKTSNKRNQLSPDSSIGKQKLANLILSLSYEKQSDDPSEDKIISTAHQSRVNLITEEDYIYIDDVKPQPREKLNDYTHKFDNILARTRNVLNKYQDALNKNKK